MQVTVRDLMTPRPATIPQHATIGEAIQMVLERALDEIYIVDEAGRLTGTVSDYVLLKASLLRTDATQPVTRVMSHRMIVLQPESTLEEVACLFRESSYPRLAVLEDGRVVGQLSRREVLRTLLVLDEMNARQQADHRIEPAADATPPRPVSLRAAAARAMADEAACSGL